MEGNDMAKTLKCNRCKNKYRMYAVAGEGCKHNTYELYSEDSNLRFYTIQKTVGRKIGRMDYDKKGRVICDCPKCHQLMVAV
jgi:hypothetical protein